MPRGYEIRDGKPGSIEGYRDWPFKGTGTVLRDIKGWGSLTYTRMVRWTAAILLPLFLAACFASFSATTPAQKVYALQSDYNGLLAAVVKYESQPRCSVVVVRSCSKPAVVASIRKADNIVYAALSVARSAVRMPNPDEGAVSKAIRIARSSISGLRAIMSAL